MGSERDGTEDDRAVERIRAAVAGAVATLTAAGARDEALAEYVPAHRRFLIRREPVLRGIGRVWRLGVFLLDADGTLRATGTLVRATPPGRPQYQSASAEERRSLRAAAARGRFRDGETVNFDASVIPLDASALRAATGPLFLRDGQPLVRWSPSAGDAGARGFEAYLAERVDLLAHPPEGA
ncbi:hypothetical protein [Leifsonia sp. 21MFCrub1.1]|uniref:hypothetical protein n=1 Tax=Leifsonia sp. 21MFCrub1.1 TaxID=1798223 RepID=UPI0008929C21|nr:hypothetical protein [Leifsonia sp. 21MFCrub1.1]SEB15141.1 hypothetical protein SAMN04515680_3783 [Leifsonia sp. 21MFCrub1.1]